ncbi:MAG TPA: hypothetical protein ENH03_05550 [Candidatus Bathyarchaeota archaeon]|nr:hypothetical protein [Candidatus Bathyarchaeota archaeon]
MIMEFLRRNRFEVMYEILFFCRTERQKTKIMYKCNLSFRLLEKYVNFLLSRNLLENLGEKRYHTTPRGMKFLEEYEHIRRMLNETKNEGSGISPRNFGLGYKRQTQSIRKKP